MFWCVPHQTNGPTPVNLSTLNARGLRRSYTLRPSATCKLSFHMLGAFFRNLQTGALEHSKAQKPQASAQSCVLARHKLGFSPDKLRFTPDGTEKSTGWGGRIRTYGTRYQKALSYQLNGPPRSSPLAQSEESSRFQSQIGRES